MKIYTRFRVLRNNNKNKFVRKFLQLYSFFRIYEWVYQWLRTREDKRETDLVIKVDKTTGRRTTYRKL